MNYPLGYKNKKRRKKTFFSNKTASGNAGFTINTSQKKGWKKC
ncbi:hypothetical protein [Undibacterium sp. TS12]|nr:hypothetical protein [Undibacterium sp. TS12]